MASTEVIISRAEQAAALKETIHEFALDWLVSDSEAIGLIMESGRGSTSR